MRLESIVENIIVIYLNQIGSQFLPANFPLSYFDRQIINSAHLFPPIRVYLHLPYIYCCTAHYSSVLFWAQNRLDQIKVITRAHLCHWCYVFLPNVILPNVVSPNVISPNIVLPNVVLPNDFFHLKFYSIDFFSNYLT
jgi:hypothetical protein